MNISCIFSAINDQTNPYYMKTLKCSLFFLLLSGAVSAQEKNTMVYEVSYGSNPTITVKANDAYATVTNENLSKMEKEGKGDKIFDFKNNAVAFVFDLGKNPWFVMESIDTVFGRRDDAEKIGKQQIINGFKCEGYKLKAKLSFASGLYGLGTTSANYDYTVWVATDAKANSKISKAILGLLTTNMVNADLHGLIVKVETRGTVYKKEFTMETILKSSTTESLKTSDIKFPWKDSRFQPALTMIESSRMVGSQEFKSGSLESSWTWENTKEYQDRMQELFKAVTGNDYEKFKHVRANPYM